MKTREDGFTIIELMIVVLIIGVLVAIALPTYGTMAGKARDASCQHNLKAIDSSIAQYQAVYGVFPPDVAALSLEGHLKEIPIEPHYEYGDYTIVSGWARADGNHQTYP